MKTNKRSFFIQIIVVCFFLSTTTSVLAQDKNDGQLSRLSSGRISMSLEITNSSNPILKLVDSQGLGSTISGFLEQPLTRRLAETGQVEIPVCLAGNGESEFTVSVAAEDGGEMMLTGANGEKFPYEVNIKGNRGARSDSSKKVQYRPPEDGSCDVDSALKVEINLSETLPAAGRVLLNGRFRLIITSE